jgi:glutaredoxin
MGVLTYLLSLYFAGSLGVAGLSKVEEPEAFIAVLRRQKLLPPWSVALVGYGLPWAEMVLALALVTGIVRLVTAQVVLLLFVGFLGAKTYLFLTKSDVGCGCYNAKDGHIERPDLIASSILAGAAAMHLWLVTQVSAIDLVWRIALSVLAGGLVLVLLATLVVRQRIHRPADPDFFPAAPGLDVGHVAPHFVGMDQYGRSITYHDVTGKRALIAFVDPACPACKVMVQALRSWHQQKSVTIDLVVMGGDDHLRNLAYAQEQHISALLLTIDDMVRDAFGVQQFPVVFALDEAGIIRARGRVNATEHLIGLLKAAYPIPGDTESPSQSLSGVE